VEGDLAQPKILAWHPIWLIRMRVGTEWANTATRYYLLLTQQHRHHKIWM